MTQHRAIASLVLVCVSVGVTLSARQLAGSNSAGDGTVLQTLAEQAGLSRRELARVLAIDDPLALKDAVKVLQAAAEKDPRDANVAYVLWRSLFALEDFDGAARSAELPMRAICGEAGDVCAEADHSHLKSLALIWEARALSAGHSRGTSKSVALLENAIKHGSRVPVDHRMPRSYLWVTRSDVHPAVQARFDLVYDLASQDRDVLARGALQRALESCPQYEEWRVCDGLKRRVKQELYPGDAVLPAVGNRGLPEFDALEWKRGDPSVRGRMVRDLVYKDQLLGRARVQLLNLLGEPDEADKNELRYRVGDLGYKTQQDVKRFGDIWRVLWELESFVEVRPSSPLATFPLLPRRYVLYVNLKGDVVVNAEVSRDPLEPIVDRHGAYERAVLFAALQDRLELGTSVERAQVIVGLEQKWAEGPAWRKHYDPSDSRAIAQVAASHTSKPQADEAVMRASEYWIPVVRAQWTAILNELHLPMPE